MLGNCRVNHFPFFHVEWFAFAKQMNAEDKYKQPPCNLHVGPAEFTFLHFLPSADLAIFRQRAVRVVLQPGGKILKPFLSVGIVSSQKTLMGQRK